jgi:uncharacterized membrane protein
MSSDNQLIVSQLAAFQGPIPPPAVLREYEQLEPGAANRIIKMAEKEQEHRHYLENQEFMLDMSARNTGNIFMLRGQIFATCIVFAYFILIGIFAVLGLASVVTVALGTALVVGIPSIVGLLLFTKKLSDKGKNGTDAP